MKTSSVNFNAPSPMKVNISMVACSGKSFSPRQWKRRKREIVFEQASELYRGILSGIHGKKKEYITGLRTDGTVESTDTIVKLKTKIENSSTFESDPDFVKTLIQNCIDERVSLKRKRAKVEEKQFKTLNKETATHIGIREAEVWFRPIDLAKECDIYISSRSGSHKEIPITYGYTQYPLKNRSQNFKTKIKENYPQYLEK
ncbi:hypothetical protein TNCV_679881 [Trichonephila clavipes]|nr:hypothetical protein TNCV_679881 [Trichonephila clavipes]